jgi:predicted Zn finger-like uncharacterized protein
MPVVLRCSDCETNLRVPDDLLGKTVRCPNCRKTFTATSEAGPLEEGPTAAPALAPSWAAITTEKAPPRRGTTPARAEEEEDEPLRKRPGRSAERSERERDGFEDEGPFGRRGARGGALGWRRDEEEDEDVPRPPSAKAAGWRGVRAGLSLVMFAGWAQLVLVGVACIGVGVLLLLGVSFADSLFGNSNDAGARNQAVGSAAGFAGGAIVLLALVVLLALAEMVLRLVGYGLCMRAPALRNSGLKPLAITAFSCAAAAVGLGLFFGFLLRGLRVGGPRLSWALDLGVSAVGLASFVVFLFFLRSVCVNLRDQDAAGGVVKLMIGWAVWCAAAVLSFVVLICGGMATAFSAATSRTSSGAAASFGAFGVLMILLFSVVGLAWLALCVWYLLVVVRVRGVVDRHLGRDG